jgi:hypothetical protein
VSPITPESPSGCTSYGVPLDLQIRVQTTGAGTKNNAKIADLHGRVNKTTFLSH